VAYNYAEFLPERRKMMQAWADYLDLLKENNGSEKIVREDDRFTEHHATSVALAVAQNRLYVGFKPNPLNHGNKTP